MAREPYHLLYRLSGLCPICLGAPTDGLTAGLPGAALVLIVVLAVVLASFGRLAYRLGRHARHDAAGPGASVSDAVP